MPLFCFVLGDGDMAISADRPWSDREAEHIFPAASDNLLGLVCSVPFHARYNRFG